MTEKIRAVWFWVAVAYVCGFLGIMAGKWWHPLNALTKIYAAIGVPLCFYVFYSSWKKKSGEAGERAVPLYVPSETLRRIWRIGVAMIVCDAMALALGDVIPFTDSQSANFGMTFALGSILGFAGGIWWQFAKGAARSRIPVFPVVVLGVVAFALAVFAIAVGFGVL